MDGKASRLLSGLHQLQDEYRRPVADAELESPRAASSSLQDAVAQAPADYQDYLLEAVACYEGAQFRAAILTTWAATVQHLYMTAEGRRGGISAFQQANLKRFGKSSSYREMKKADDFLYLREKDFILLGEDAGMYNRSARQLLVERLELRNRCGHPTKYKPGREETVVFIESLLLNVIGGAQVNW